MALDFESEIFEVEGFTVFGCDDYESGDYYKRRFGDNETVSAWRDRFVKKFPNCSGVVVQKGNGDAAHGNMLLKNLRETYQNYFLRLEILELKDRILSLEQNNDQKQDPYQILGVEKGCDLESAKNARAKMSKMFHPDKYASMDLPQEILLFVTRKMQEINGAFDEINETLSTNEDVTI